MLEMKTVRLCVLSDQSRLKDARRDSSQNVITGPRHIRGRTETYPGADGKGFIPAISAFRIIPASAGAVQVVTDDVSHDLTSNE